MTKVTDFPDEHADREAGEIEEKSSESLAKRMPKLPLGSRIAEYYRGVILELRKVAWPNRTEVRNTTVVVIIAVVFFGFYLWGVDMLVSYGFEQLQKAIR